MGWNAPGFADGGAVRGQIAGQLSLEDPEVLQRYLGESLGRNAKILGEHLGRFMSEPVRHQERIELACIAGVAADHELTTLRAEPLRGMRQARREIPEVALIDVSDVGPPHGIEN